MWHAFENLKIFRSSLMSAWQKTPLNDVRKNLTPCQWENLQIRKVFSRVSLRTGPNDARELNLEKRMWLEGVSRVRWASILNAHLFFVLEGVGVSSLRQVFPHFSLGHQWSFLPRPHHSSVIFEFLVIFKACVTSSVYWSMSQWSFFLSPHHNSSTKPVKFWDFSSLCQI
jgi:hypothetical protein